MVDLTDEFATRWKHKSHINVLELEALLLGVKHQICRFHTVDKRIFQLSDSYVCISVVSKCRSGSRQLNRVLRHLSALLLSFRLQLVVAHVESTENPSDADSRNEWQYYLQGGFPEQNRRGRESMWN